MSPWYVALTAVLAVLSAVLLVTSVLLITGRVRHRHCLAPVSVMHPANPIGQLAGTPPQTIVLLRCEGCGELGTVQLAGSWSLDQVRGISPVAVRDPADTIKLGAPGE